ncbi:MAG: alpha/beta hydrolase [Gammaproteobacteria bacterium]|nr:alpha/beta hydrolase [Gammaproteobacteria bacterium]MYF67148.1 alpha/beta hydrolase [Gammaproteobacteria bacterium]MYK36581.1 alpha/beta hydrolase [Gammaproteobacteria bacterium]
MRDRNGKLTRRQTLAGAGAALVASAAGSVAKAEAGEESKTFILVHGTWLGGWSWQFVRRILEQAGHDVYAPSLTGCGDRAHTTSPDVGLDTHIQDIVNIIDFESLDDVILVGHSFAGMVITGVADARRERIRRIVFFDALVPAGDRMSGVSRTPEGELSQYFIKRMEKFVDGYRMDYFDSYPLKMVVPDSEPELQALLKEKITLHPMRAWSDVLELKNGGWEGLPRTYIHCVGQEYSMTSDFMVGPAREPGWQFIEMDIPRGGMLTHPELVAETFVNLT